MHTITSSLPWQSLIESPEHRGNAEGSWGTSWGTSLCILGTSLSPPQLCPHPPVHSSASLPPGNSAGKRQEADVVLICAQLISTATSTPRKHRSSQSTVSVGVRSCSALLCSALCLCGAAHPSSPCPSSRTVSWLSQHLHQARPWVWEAEGAALIPPAKPRTEGWDTPDISGSSNGEAWGTSKIFGSKGTQSWHTHLSLAPFHAAPLSTGVQGTVIPVIPGQSWEFLEFRRQF